MMKKPDMKRYIKSFLIIFCATLFLYGCAGTDVPWQQIQDDTSVGGGANPGGNGGGTPGTNPPPSNIPGCTVRFDGKIRMDTRMKDGSQKVIGAQRPLPPIFLHFDKGKVTMVGSEFSKFDITVTENNYKLTLKQKDGTTAEGTFDSATGKIDVNQKDRIIFTMEVLNNLYQLKPFDLTTDKNFAVATDLLKGKGDGRNEKGELVLECKDPKNAANDICLYEALNFDPATKKVVFVGGGFLIPDNFNLSPELRDMAILVILDGQLDKDPSSPDCASSGGGNGQAVVVREVVKNSDGNSSEVDLKDNTLDFGRVFVPEKGKDLNPQTNPNFTAIKTLKVTNIGDAISLNAKTENGFTIPAVQIGKGESKEFTVTFSMPEVTYDMNNPLPSNNQSGSIVIGDKTIQLKGVSKRAAAELSIIDLGNNPINDKADLGVAPATIIGGALKCGDQDKRPILSKRIVIQNKGVRDLKVLGMQSVSDTPAPIDPGCNISAYRDGGGIKEFKVIADKSLYTGKTEEGNCDEITGSFPCVLKMGDGKVNIISAYKSVNPNPIVAQALVKDKATLKISYQLDTGSAVTKEIAVEAGISPDRSDAIILKSKNPDYTIRADGNAKLLIDSSRDKKADGSYEYTQNFEIVNKDIKLKGVTVTIPEGTDKDRFQVQGIPAPIDIPQLGTANFAIKFTAPTAKEGDVFSANLIIKFTPDEPGASDSSFKANITALIDHKPLTGYVKFVVDRMATYVGNNYVSVIDSVAFRSVKSNHLSSGPIYFKFDPDIKGDGTSHPYLRKVTLLPPSQLFDPVNGSEDEIREKLEKMTPEDRKALVRLYTTKLTTGNGTKEKLNNRVPDERDCDEPMGNLEKGYVQGECSYFYYLLASKPDPNDPTNLNKRDPKYVGVYDDNTGEIIVNNIDLRMLNPYHGQVGGSSYDATSKGGRNFKLNALFNTTVTTLPITSSVLKNPYPEVSGMVADIPMVDPRQIVDDGELAIPEQLAKDDILNKYPCQMRESWRPWLTPHDVPFSCYITSTAPYAIKGYPATPRKNGDYSVILSLLMRFNEKNGPDQVPFFLSNERFWASIQGRLVQCEEDSTKPVHPDRWKNCKVTELTKESSEPECVQTDGGSCKEK